MRGLNRCPGLTGVLFWCLACGPLMAQDGFEAADTNSDDRLDATEMREYVAGRLDQFSRHAELFAGLDSDENGFLSRDEFQRRMTVLQSLRESNESPPAGQVEEFVDRYNRMFAGRDPVVGQILPDATGFDEQGQPFELRQTRGQYTVIVSGCLT